MLVVVRHPETMLVAFGFRTGRGAFCPAEALLSAYRFATTDRCLYKPRFVVANPSLAHPGWVVVPRGLFNPMSSTAISSATTVLPLRLKCHASSCSTPTNVTALPLRLKMLGAFDPLLPGQRLRRNYQERHRGRSLSLRHAARPTNAARRDTRNRKSQSLVTADGHTSGQASQARPVETAVEKTSLTTFPPYLPIPSLRRQLHSRSEMVYGTTCKFVMGLRSQGYQDTEIVEEMQYRLMDEVMKYAYSAADVRAIITECQRLGLHRECELLVDVEEWHSWTVRPEDRWWEQEGEDYWDPVTGDEAVCCGWWNEVSLTTSCQHAHPQTRSY